MVATTSSSTMAGPTSIGTVGVAYAGLPMCSATSAGMAPGAALSFILGAGVAVGFMLGF